MSNFDILSEKIKTKIDSKTTLGELIIKVDKINEVLNTLIELIKTRNF